MIAFLINFTARYQGNKLLSFLSSTIMLGYAVPGLILAIASRNSSQSSGE